MEKPFAVFATRLGGPEVLEARTITMPEAHSGQVVIEHTAIGVNFVDIYLRSGQPHSQAAGRPCNIDPNGAILAVSQMSGEFKNLNRNSRSPAYVWRPTINRMSVTEPRRRNGVTA
jgi:NADPH:quinone reductase-like Zn-dependent oxidoreductase